MKTSVLSWSVLFILSQFSASVGYANPRFQFPETFSQFLNLSNLSEAPVLPGNLQCLNNQHESLAYNNNQVMKWKSSTKDQYLDRGFVSGVISNLLPDHTQHTHFGLNIDQNAGSDIEVIYNDEFGALPDLKVGTTVVACGDYITVSKNARMPSPYGAIIHWVHYNPGNRDGGRHPSGFLIINGKPYGIAPNLN